MSDRAVPNVVVVGTGFGGLEAAFYLRKRLGKRVKITEEREGHPIAPPRVGVSLLAHRRRLK